MVGQAWSQWSRVLPSGVFGPLNANHNYEFRKNLRSLSGDALIRKAN